ncbi:hypothetical protein OSK18_27945, partial [Escherichia coli]|nr:hypothetical protein [Escherichia coli]
PTHSPTYLYVIYKPKVSSTDIFQQENREHLRNKSTPLVPAKNIQGGFDLVPTTGPLKGAGASYKAKKGVHP